MLILGAVVARVQVVLHWRAGAARSGPTSDAWQSYHVRWIHIYDARAGMGHGRGVKNRNLA